VWDCVAESISVDAVLMSAENLPARYALNARIYSSSVNGDLRPASRSAIAFMNGMMNERSLSIS